MKTPILALALALTTVAPIAARADTAPASMSHSQMSHSQMAHTEMSPAQLSAMHAKLTQAEQLVASINHSYGTQFAIGPQSTMSAMSHMAAANMEMAKAMMELQETWTGSPSPSAYPISEGGQ